MSIISDLFSSGSSWPGIIKSAVDIGGNLYNTYNKQNTSDNYASTLANSETQQYNDTLNYNNALADYYSKASGAAASARASANSAAAATDRNRQAAQLKAKKYLDSVYKKTMAMYAPFRDTASQLLPQMQKSYEGGLNTSNLLSAYLSNPENMAKLNQSRSAAASGPDLPSYLKGA